MNDDTSINGECLSISKCIYAHLFLALSFSGPHCCNSSSHIDSEDFDLGSWIPYLRQDVSISFVTDLVSGPDTRPKVNRTQYRPKADRVKLEDLINAWRSKMHLDDPVVSIFPIDDILSSRSVAQLARLLPGDSHVASPSNLVDYLQQSEDWASAYSTGLYDIISDFNAPILARKQLKPARKVALGLGNRSVIDFRTPADKKKKKSEQTVPISAEEQSQSQAHSQAALASSSFTFQLTVDRTSVKHSIPDSPPKFSSKRVKREALKELSLN